MIVRLANIVRRAVMLVATVELWNWAQEKSSGKNAYWLLQIGAAGFKDGNELQLGLKNVKKMQISEYLLCVQLKNHIFWTKTKIIIAWTTTVKL